MLLNSLGIECVSLHSMMSQKERLSALARFKSSQVKVLIATDVASRGLDVPLVSVEEDCRDYISCFFWY